MESNFIDNMVNEVKSQGVFDAFRRDSMSDVDTKPAYQNLKQRVENAVSKFLSEQKWTPEMNKNQLRERLRKHIIDAGFLEMGVQRIVDQVVNPKISTVFQPRIEDIVYKYLGVEKPEKKIEVKASRSDYNVKECLSVNTNLLPHDLEAVSPDSDKSIPVKIKLDSKYVYGHHDEDDDESPPFEPLETLSPYKIKEEISNSHLSGLSGLTSQFELHEENKIVDNKITEKKYEKEEINVVKKQNIQINVGDNSQESPLSRVSSDSKLSIDSNEEQINQKNFLRKNTTDVDISEEAQMPKFNENSNSCQILRGEDLHFDIKKDEIKFQGTDRNNELLPPVYQSSMLERTEEKPMIGQVNVTQNVEEISNNSFNTESRNSMYFDDDSERCGLQIVEDPTQSVSRDQSRPPSVVFQKPENREIKITQQNDSFSPENKTVLTENLEQEKNCDWVYDIKSPARNSKMNYESKFNDLEKNKYDSSSIKSYSVKNEDKHRSSSKSSSSYRQSSSSSSHKSHRSKDKKSERDKDKNKKITSFDSKSSSTEKHSSPRYSNSSAKEFKATSSSHKSSTGKHKSDKLNKNSSTTDKDHRDKKRSHERSREEKYSKSEKHKSTKDSDDHASEKLKRYHRKSTDSNDGDKKSYSQNAAIKGTRASKESTVEPRGSSNENNRQDYGNSGTIYTKQHELIEDLYQNLCQSQPISNPVLVENLHADNIEFFIGTSHFLSSNEHNEKLIAQSSSEVISMEINEKKKYFEEAEEKLNVISEEEKEKNFLDQRDCNNLNQQIFRPVESPTKFEVYPARARILEKPKQLKLASEVYPEVKFSLVLSPEKMRFENLISPPPKKRKYDPCFNICNATNHYYWHNQTNNFKFLNLDSTDEDCEINLFGFDIQEEQENYQKTIRDYKISYEKYFCFAGNINFYKNFNCNIEYISDSNQNQIIKNNNDSQLECKTINSNMQNLHYSPSKIYTTINHKTKRQLTSSKNSDGKSLTINCFDNYIETKSDRKKKASPTLSESSSIGSKENDYSDKLNYLKTNTGGKFKKSAKKTNYQTLQASQRYKCEDLYKPRLKLSHPRSRRRALE